MNYPKNLFHSKFKKEMIFKWGRVGQKSITKGATYQGGGTMEIHVIPK